MGNGDTTYGVHLFDASHCVLAGYISDDAQVLEPYCHHDNRDPSSFASVEIFRVPGFPRDIRESVQYARTLTLRSTG